MKMNADLRKEREAASFKTELLTNFLDGGAEQTLRRKKIGESGRDGMQRQPQPLCVWPLSAACPSSRQAVAADADHCPSRTLPSFYPLKVHVCIWTNIALKGETPSSPQFWDGAHKRCLRRAF